MHPACLLRPRTQHLNRFYLAQRRQAAVAKLREATQAAVPDLGVVCSAGSDHVNPQRAATVLRWRLRQLEAALAAAEDEVDRLQCMYELRSQTNAELRRKHEEMKKFSVRTRSVVCVLRSGPSRAFHGMRAVSLLGVVRVYRHVRPQNPTS